MEQSESVHIFGLLSCLLSVFVSVFTETCDSLQNGRLRIFDGDSEIPSTNCILYTGPNCTNGRDNFPNGLGQGLSVEKPGNFTVNAVLDTFTPVDGHNTYRVNRLSYFWDGPTSAIGRHSLKGFYLKMAKIGSQVFCKLYDLQGYTFIDNANPRFELESFPVTDSGSFIVDMFSLPPPVGPELENGLYGRHIVSLPGYHNLNATDDARVDPAFWETTISVQQFTEDKVLQVKFSLPETGSPAHFDTYRVAVVRKGKTNTYQDYVTIPEHLQQGGFAVYNFTNIPYTEYFVKVRPWELYFYNEDRCQCYTKIYAPLGERGCRGSCATTETSVFNFKGFSVTNLRTSHSTHSRGGQSFGDAAFVVVTVSVALIGVLVVLFISGNNVGISV